MINKFSIYVISLHQKENSLLMLKAIKLLICHNKFIIKMRIRCIFNHNQIILTKLKKFIQLLILGMNNKICKTEYSLMQEMKLLDETKL
jgi:hypothetical protein